MEITFIQVLNLKFCLGLAIIAVETFHKVRTVPLGHQEK